MGSSGLKDFYFSSFKPQEHSIGPSLLLGQHGEGGLPTRPARVCLGRVYSWGETAGGCEAMRLTTTDRTPLNSVWCVVRLTTTDRTPLNSVWCVVWVVIAAIGTTPAHLMWGTEVPAYRADTLPT